MPTKKVKKEKNTKMSFIIEIIIVIIIALLLRLFIIEVIKVVGESMEPTLMNEELVLIEKVGYYFSEPSRFDIVIFEREGEVELLVKRVIGLAGETVEIINGEIYINGEKLKDDTFYKEKLNYDFPAVTVPKGKIFVMGDNRGNSKDSRYFGSIEISRIRGRGILIIWPPNEIKAVK
jgi:signal peptidase I